MIHINTIPHSGTRFVRKFFYSVGFKDIEFATQPVDTSEYFTVKHFPQFERPDERPPAVTVTALRDPCLVTISNLREDMVNEWPGMEMDRLADMYNVVIRRAAKRKFVYFDVECPEEKREAHLVGILKELNVYNVSQLPDIRSFTEVWQPVGEYGLDCDWKTNYKLTGDLPAALRTTELQRHINWYNSKLRECVYDNIT